MSLFFSLKETFTFSSTRAETTTRGAKSRRRCTTSLWGNCGLIRSVQFVPALTVKSGTRFMHDPEIIAEACSVVTSVSCLSTVGGHRHCEHHDQGHLPSQILSLQLFLQRGPTQSESVVAQRVIVSLNWETTKYPW